MEKAKKGAVVEEVKATLEKSNIAIVTHYRGLTVAEMTALRRDMRKSGSEYRVVKNTLTKRAAQGTSFEGLGEILTGPVGLASSSDPVAPAKVLSDFAKTHPNLQIIGGIMEGRPIDLAGVNALAKLPSREVLLAKLLGTMMGPVQGVVGVLAAVPGSFVRVLEQIRQQKEEQSAA
ncbi:MAG: 50S ribosomal protein L10 [Magnetococcales bacterium]|nr:50S ribosomal protein L10 [Magnetococcales bacterium]